MKLVLISAITASVFVAVSPCPTFAQSTPAEAADQAAALAASADPNGAIVMPKGAKVVVPHNATVAIAPALVTPPAVAGSKPFDSLIATHAASNGVPAELVHRVVVRESRYRAGAVGRGGASGLMQIKLATARAMGYSGSASGLLDPETNLTYGVRYLAGAYRAAGGNQGRAVGYYASGYYHAAKRVRPVNAYAKAMPEPAVFTTAAGGEPVVVTQREPRRRHKR